MMNQRKTRKNGTDRIKTVVAKGVLMIIACAGIVYGAKGLVEQVVTIPDTSNSVNDFQPKSELPWNLQLVNRNNPITTDYSGELIELKNGEKIDQRIFPELQRMFDDARAEGVDPIVTSGYRTREMQEQILVDKIEEFRLENYPKNEARLKAENWVALPDTSEHQLGIAIDINSENVANNQEVYQWLAMNAHRYGFIHRYPAHKTDITGVNGEEWHYRYVGVEAASEMVQNDYVLEEYLENRQ